MQNYFPYSHIINGIYNQIKQGVTRNPYVGDWQVADVETEIAPAPITSISEIYY